MFKASKQILDDFAQLQSTVDAEMRYGLKYVEEQEILFGDGTGVHLHGIVPQASAFSAEFRVEQQNGIDDLCLAMLQAQLARFPASGHVLHFIDWAKIELTKDTLGRYILANPSGLTGPTLWGLPVVATEAAAFKGKFLTGAFNAGAQIFDREDANVVSGVASAQFTYINNGDGYAPGWRREFSRTGDEMTGNLYLKNDGRVNFCIMNEDGTPRMWLFKDKGGDGIHINNGNDGGGDYVFHKDGSFYAPLAVRAGGSKKLAVRSDNNSALSAHFNLWGDANRPTVIELDDDQGWQYYSQRNPDGSVLLTVNGDIMANRKLNVGAATFSSDGNVNGSLWGGWLNDWINNTIINRFVKDIRLGGIEYAQAWNGPGFNDTPGYVITGVGNGNSDELIDGIHRRPLQKLIGSVWYNVTSI
ncbi:phage major capsid protein [Salmonella enterica]|nr:phage major capsid protein [Salmonella enterica]